MIIYATGFDPIVGSFDRIDIRGLDGPRLKDKWSGGPRTYLGLQVTGFPNLFTLVGPHNAAIFCNLPRCIEQNVDFVSDLIAYMLDKGYARVGPTVEAEDAWTDLVNEIARHFLFSRVDSWMTGVNKNLADRLTRNVMVFAGGAPQYRARCEQVAANGYEGFELK
jgi:cation diffusion facilitator CzcD-associated flavoprotein CzcO